MTVTIRKYTPEDIPQMIRIWNEVVEDGVAFPQIECLDVESGTQFFGAQSHCGVAESESGELLGLYILHPNNVGRCGHICNASYAVASTSRGNHIGEALVRDSIEQGKAHGFRILQFNAVVRSNTAARRLYKKLGFTPLGVIPNGFLSKNSEYVDIVPYYIEF
ncbi:MAG: GNAT family N-acetyltransferase [Ruminococcus sp.]|nr:GNAT family N-acetyltransferase [Ruminococcus sp.]